MSKNITKINIFEQFDLIQIVSTIKDSWNFSSNFLEEFKK